MPLDAAELDGPEPDGPEWGYEAAIAAERGFLAWHQCALGVLVAAVAVAAPSAPLGWPRLRYGVGIGLVVVAIGIAGGGLRRWMRTDGATCRNRPLPGRWATGWISHVLAAALGAVLLVLVAAGR